MTGKSALSVSVIETGSLLSEVDELRASGWRIVQILCVARPEGAEVTYSFGLGLEMRSLRIVVPAEASVPSVTALYPGAFLYEN